MLLFDTLRARERELCEHHTLHSTCPDLWVEIRHVNILDELALFI